ncbi:MAG TPA: class II aldolase/adducin family protein [Candidatus Hydrogenedentes bacterium]|nr:class II aldolase/adducin family protein [Candidatus Hydrogenedentota bacterium]
MTPQPIILEQLVNMSHYLGDPGKPYAILGEGNTSARIDEDTFFIKASGTTLATMKPEDFLPVSISRVVSILDDAHADDAAVAAALRGALLDPSEKRMPSVETVLHAVLYQYPDINFIGHCHPEAINALMCSVHAEEAALERLCPDHIVVVGRSSVYVPYTDPGLQLARAIRQLVREFIDREGELPKSIYLQNHGFFALGATPKAVCNIFDMAEKMARILVGAYSVGGPRFMSEADINRIHTRPDEHYRQKLLSLKK